jgi:hypothetical protein
MALLFYLFKDYLKDMQNILELILLQLSLAYVILYHFQDTALYRGHLAVIALIGFWTDLTSLMGKIPAAGIYILMITNVVQRVISFFTFVCNIYDWFCN